MNAPFDATHALHLACSTLEIEAAAVQALKSRLGAEFVRAVQLVLAAGGHVAVMGMGKSGHVGRKLAATLASTGTPAIFVHPAEASHGDLGMIRPQDVVLAISNSGESEEITRLLPLIKRLGAPLIAMTGRADSTLGRCADVLLDSSVEREACPLNLAPTASTTAQMALGDALAVALLDARGFKAEDFARSHPGGALGRRLLMRVQELMRSGEAVPRVAPEATLSELMREMTSKGLGASAIADAGGRVLGIFTDGDLRRLVETGRLDLDENIGTYLHYEDEKPFFAASSRFPKIGLTSRMLMSHTACIWCDKFNPRPEATKALNLETNKKHKEYFYTDKPGTAYHYSNYGAGILGCMIEAITGERLDDAVSELIFDRMGLDAGYSPDYLKVPGNITSEVIREYGEGIDLDNDYVFSYGNCWMKCSDLCRIGIRIPVQGSGQAGCSK